MPTGVWERKNKTPPDVLKERVRLRNKAWREANREANNARRREKQRLVTMTPEKRAARNAQQRASYAKQDLSKKKAAARKQADVYAERAAAIKAELINQKGGGCSQCGYARHLVALDFDHIHPEEKQYTVAHLIMRAAVSGDFLPLLYEASKCRVLCSNCHRLRTATRSAGADYARRLTRFKPCLEGYPVDESHKNPYWDFDEATQEWVRNEVPV